MLEKYSHKKIILLFKIGKSDKKEPVSFGPLFPPSKLKPWEDTAYNSHLNPKFTFENYAVSGSNQMANAAAQAVAQAFGKAYNPLFFYGGVGVGKTHLMQAIGIELIRKNQGIKVLFCTGEEFTNEIIQAIRLKTTHNFKDKFRNVNVLLIDDVQFIAGKNSVQEEFFYTFNAIHRRGSQIVLTSDKPPAEIARLEERLQSRFEGGLIVDIQQPDFELRTAILLIKAKQRGLNLPMDVAQELASQVSDGRRLEGTLIRFFTESQVKNREVSAGSVRDFLGYKRENPIQTKSFPPGDYINAVSRFYNIKVSLLKGSTRLKNVVFPRHILMFVLKTELSLSLNEIGSLLGGRDHTTILHGVEKIKHSLEKNDSWEKDINTIKNIVAGV